jgi:hypothetical protein
MPPKKKSLLPNWNKPNVTGDKPSSRSGHTLTLVSGGNGDCYMFGGMRAALNVAESDKGGTLSNELYRLSLKPGGDVHWSKVSAGGRIPPPTWRHTANSFGSRTAITNAPSTAASTSNTEADTQIIIFGGFTGGIERSNEVWVLNTEHMTWSRPVASASYSKNENSHVPAPRGSHSSAVINNELVVFGGYGGQGYARQDFNDLHALSLSSWKWRNCDAHGTGPEVRSGHTSSVILGRWMFVIGGWNASTQFQDVHVLDTNPTESIRGQISQNIIDSMGVGVGDSDDEAYSISEGDWVSFLYIIFLVFCITCFLTSCFHFLYLFYPLNQVWSTPLLSCNKVGESIMPVMGMERSVHSAIVTPAVPNWKIFIYGGHGTDREKASNNMSVYSNTVQMLECKVGEPYGARSSGKNKF